MKTLKACAWAFLFYFARWVWRENLIIWTTQFEIKLCLLHIYLTERILIKCRLTPPCIGAWMRANQIWIISTTRIEYSNVQTGILNSQKDMKMKWIKLFSHSHFLVKREQQLHSTGVSCEWVWFTNARRQRLERENEERRARVGLGRMKEL